jgi:hypothetical protein
MLADWWINGDIVNASLVQQVEKTLIPIENMETSKPQGKCLLLCFLVLVYFRPNQCTLASFLFRLHTHLIFYSKSESEHMNIYKVANAFSVEIRNCS